MTAPAPMNPRKLRKAHAITLTWRDRVGKPHLPWKMHFHISGEVALRMGWMASFKVWTRIHEDGKRVSIRKAQIDMGDEATATYVHGHVDVPMPMPHLELRERQRALGVPYGIAGDTLIVELPEWAWKPAIITTPIAAYQPALEGIMRRGAEVGEATLANLIADLDVRFTELLGVLDARYVRRGEAPQASEGSAILGIMSAAEMLRAAGWTVTPPLTNGDPHIPHSAGVDFPGHR